MNEIWKTIIGYEGTYEVSNLGRVKSLKRIEECGGKCKIRTRNERILKWSISKGYRIVALCKNGKAKSYPIHRLVMGIFCPIDEKKEVNHKDGIKTNNNLDNLEWCSPSENMKHAYDFGLCYSGEKHYKSKLSSKDVGEIKDLYFNYGLITTKIAKIFNVSHGAIYAIVKGENWKRHAI